MRVANLMPVPALAVRSVHFRHSQTGAPSRAFTLLELLLAASVGVLISALLLMLVGNVAALWQSAQSDLAIDGQSGAALEILSADLQGIVTPSVPAASLAANIIDSSAELQRHGWTVTGTIKPAGPVSFHAASTSAIENFRFGRSGVWLRLVTTKLDTNEDSRRASTPVAVGYQIVRRVNAAGSARYELCRSVVRQVAATSGGTGGTFESGYDFDASPYNTPSSTAGDPGTVLSPATIDTLAVNVVDFGVCLYRRGANGDLVRDFPGMSAAVPYRITTAQGPPVAADLFIRTLTNEGAAMLANLESGRIPPASGAFAEAWWDLVETHSTVIHRRVKIYSAANR